MLKYSTGFWLKVFGTVAFSFAFWGNSTKITLLFSDRKTFGQASQTTPGSQTYLDQQQRYEVAELPDQAGGQTSVVVEINNQNQCVGFRAEAPPSPLGSGRKKATLWNMGRNAVSSHSLSTTPSPFGSYAADISDAGEICINLPQVNTADTDTSNAYVSLPRGKRNISLTPYRPSDKVIYVNGVAKKGQYTNATGINEHGLIVGFQGSGALDTDGRLQFRACFWNLNGRMSPVAHLLPTNGGKNSYAQAVNARGQIVGKVDVAERLSPHYLKTHAARWTNNKCLDLGTLGGADSRAFDINDHGDIVGNSEVDLDYPLRGFLWSAGRMTELPSPADVLPISNSITNAMSINNQGVIVGYCSYASPAGKDVVRALLWREGRLIELNSLIPQDSGWKLLSARSINDEGCIVGKGLHNGHERAFLLKPISQKLRATSAKQNSKS